MAEPKAFCAFVGVTSHTASPAEPSEPPAGASYIHTREYGTGRLRIKQPIVGKKQNKTTEMQGVGNYQGLWETLDSLGGCSAFFSFLSFSFSLPLFLPSFIFFLTLWNDNMQSASGHEEDFNTMDSGEERDRGVTECHSSKFLPANLASILPETSHTI